MNHPSHPTTIRHWRIVGTLSSLGEAVTTFALSVDPEQDDIVLVVCLNPRNLMVTRVTRLTAGGGQEAVPCDMLPFVVRDLAETVVSERFPQH